MAAKILTVLAIIFLVIVILLSLTTALAASAASTANSITVGKLADALQMSQLLTACMSLLALAGGIGLGAAGLSAILALRQNRRQTEQLTRPNIPWGYHQRFPPDDTEFLPLPELPRPRTGIVLLDDLEADPNAGDNLFKGWLG